MVAHGGNCLVGDVGGVFPGSWPEDEPRRAKARST